MKEDDVLDSWLAGWLGFISGVIVMLVAVAVALTLSSCAVGRPDPVVPLAVASSLLPLDSLAALPPYLVPAPAGSTPRQRRQWQKAQTQNLARAGVLPAKIKNSSVATAPGAVAITRPASTVATGASTATDARKAGTRGGSAAVGPGAVATSTSAGASWWWYLVAVIAGAVGWEVLTSQVTPLRLLLKWRKLT
ncbi:hypothetical protein GO988_22590 [Hymenobacter sp. HMF4947]|uniref:Uncharacterized protein n=1 Tax=Hymenobacter ginkgonis TaxID=2682976 RepID=A0A7K1TL38_9BACT|nr:hypothetical protein [Hymenobacter ginkgonis]MVN79129.1 hypothetical protein [Hymenobacter ginkgonis]